MTHKNTEQPEALLIAERLTLQLCMRNNGEIESAVGDAIKELRRQHARIAELEAHAQPARQPLTVDEVERIYSRYGGDMVNCTRAIERAHGITQETQG